MSWIPVLLAMAAASLAAGCVSNEQDKTILREERLEALGVKTDDVINDVAPESKLPLISGEYDLEKVVNTALENNLSLRSAFLRRTEAHGAVVEAKAAAYPRLILGGGVTSDLVERDDTPDTYAATLSLTQPLWRSGAISAGIRYADLYAESTDEHIRSVLQDVVAQVSEDFLTVLLATKMTGVYEESLAVAERMLDTAKKKRAAGTASEYEVLRAEVEVATSKASLIKERNALRAAGIKLLHDMGVNQESRISIIGTLDYVSETNDLDRVVYAALLNRPDVLVAQAALGMAEESLNLVRSQYGLSVDLFANGKYQNPDPNDSSKDEWNHDAAAGVSVSLTLFDGLERRGKMRQAESKVEQARASLGIAEENARVEVVRALLAVRNAEELYASQSKNIDLSREALRMLESGFKVGRNTQIEVLDARSALTEAMGGYYNAIFSHSVARIAVRKAAGTLVAGSATKVRPEIRVDGRVF